jgi:hypothetical protein
MTVCGAVWWWLVEWCCAVLTACDVLSLKLHELHERLPQELLATRLEQVRGRLCSGQSGRTSSAAAARCRGAV